MKTIKQIADDLGLDKQKVYRYIKKNHINEAHQKGQVMWFDDAVESSIKKAFFSKTASNEPHHDAVQTTLNDTVSDVVDAVLLDQIKLLQEENRELRKLLSQEQELHARLQDRIKLLEAPTDDNVDVEEESSKGKKGFFHWIFRK